MFIIEYIISFIAAYVGLMVEYYPVFLLGAACFVGREIYIARRKNSTYPM